MSVLLSLAWFLLRLLIILLVVYLLLPVGWKIIAPRFNAAYKPSDLDERARPAADNPQDPIPRVEVDDTGGYEVQFGPDRAFRDGQVRVHYHGAWYASDPTGGQKRLVPSAPESVGPGEDALGAFTRTQTRWELEGTGLAVETRVDVYPERPFVKFEIGFPDGLEDTSTGNFKDLMFQYPAFDLHGPNQRVMAWQFAFFCPPTRDITKKGTQGPIVFYDNELNCAILGPTDHFMTAFTHQDEEGGVSHGLEGKIKEIPAGFTHAALLYFGQGINQPVVEWCDLLRNYYEVPPRDPYADPTVANLGYWSQNGAYYYYKTEKGMNYEETIEYCHRTFEEMGIPFQYFQLDSWWYQKAIKSFWKYPPGKWLGKLIGGGAFGGTIVWEAIPEQFPHGLKYLHEKTGWDFVAHARWFDPKKSPYLQNYESITWKFAGLPMEAQFWDDLMARAVKWGLACYEQDWLKNTFTRLPQLQENVGWAENWLTWMADAAQAHDLTIQYCMCPSGGFLLGGLKLPAVTNARVTGDYHARVTKQFFYPQFSQTNILAWAVGIWPSLDCYLTTTTSLSKGIYREKYPEQVTMLSNLGGGVICPGDKAERVNKPLLMKTCTEDGVLLKPDRPITANDLMFAPHAKPYIMNTWTRRAVTERAGPLMWHYVLAVNLWPRRVSDYQVTLTELGLAGDAARESSGEPPGAAGAAGVAGAKGVTGTASKRLVLYDFFARTLAPVQSDTPIALDLKRMEKRYVVVVPELLEGVALVGSPDKYATAATRLFPAITVEEDTVRCTVSYSAGASLEVLFYAKKEPKEVQCTGTTEVTWTHEARAGALHVTLNFGESAETELSVAF